MTDSTAKPVIRSHVNPYVFVVGCPRSGTTLLRRMLDAHPAIAIPKAETHWIPKFSRKKHGLGGEQGVGRPLIDALLSYDRFGKLGIGRPDLQAIVAAHPGLSYAEFVSRLFDHYGRTHGKPLAGDKTPGYVRHIGTLHDLFPSARFIHLVRDGRDVALSMLSWDKLPKSAGRIATFDKDPLATTALFWEWLVRLGLEAGARLPAGLYLEVRYEDIVRAPERSSRVICDFLQLPYDEAMPRFHEGKQRQGPGLSAKKAWLPPTSGLRDWRSQMAADDVLRFEAAAGALLEQLGYERAYPEPPGPAVEHARRLRREFSRKPHPQAWEN